ncbi:anti-sigma B factor antagonist [Streptomyces sp. 1331.2]|nr:anti-sigma B factor antagonist [Streptomyces sp. 1331.2]
MGGVLVDIWRADAEAVVCTGVGDLEIDILALAEEALTSLVGVRPPVLVVDLERVGFCDSCALNLLLGTRLSAQAVGVEFRLAAPASAVRRVLELTGAQVVFSVHASVRAALVG